MWVPVCLPLRRQYSSESAPRRVCQLVQQLPPVRVQVSSSQLFWDPEMGV